MDYVGANIVPEFTGPLGQMGGCVENREWTPAWGMGGWVMVAAS